MPESNWKAQIFLFISCSMQICLFLPFSNASINAEILSGHIRTCITGKKNTSSADIFRLSDSSNHYLVFPAFQKMRKLGIISNVPFSSPYGLTGAVISVLTYPGEMELTLIPYTVISSLYLHVTNKLTYFTNSAAIAGHIALTAPLVPQYALLI